ncbi:MAG: hypothetical protein PARBA_03346 [Parabacteroides sp.]
MIKESNLTFVFIILQLIALGGAVNGFTSHSNIVIVLSLLYFYRFKQNLTYNIRPFIMVLFVIVLWRFMLKEKYPNITFLSGRLYDVLFCFCIVRILGIKKYFYYFEKAVSMLVLLSFFLWIPIAIFPDIGDLLSQYTLPVFSKNTCDGTWGIVGFSSKYKIGEQGFFLRNLGFAWEPGRFASIVVIAFMIHLYRNNFKLLQKNFLILLFGIISSQSTTGYMAFIICVFAYFKNGERNIKGQIVRYATISIFIVVLVSAPFMMNKMRDVFNNDNFLTDNTAQWYISEERVYVPQRIEGLVLELMNIKESPLIGYGDNSINSFVRTYVFKNVDIRLSNGLLQIFAILGIPLGLLIYICLYKSSKMISKIYNVRGNYFIFIVVCSINISYNFFWEPLLLAVVLYCLFLPKDDRILLNIK